MRKTYQKIFLPLEHTESSEEMLQSSLMVSNDSEITFREQEIANITKGIIELSDIFKEIQSLVTDQGFFYFFYFFSNLFRLQKYY